MNIILTGTVEGLNTRADGSVKIVFSTQELAPSKGGELFQLRGKYCKMLLSDNNISKIQEDLVDKTILAQVGKQKTHSQRLRAVLYVKHEQMNDGTPFEEFYRNKMEMFITSIKESIDN